MHLFWKLVAIIDRDVDFDRLSCYYQFICLEVAEEICSSFDCFTTLRK